MIGVEGDDPGCRFAAPFRRRFDAVIEAVADQMNQRIADFLDDRLVDFGLLAADLQFDQFAQFFACLLYTSRCV